MVHLRESIPRQTRGHKENHRIAEGHLAGDRRKRGHPTGNSCLTGGHLTGEDHRTDATEPDATGHVALEIDTALRGDEITGLVAIWSILYCV